MLTHTLHSALRFQYRPLHVLVVGAGGNGSKFAVGMKNLHGALRALGHPGVQLTLADGDLVSQSNLVRQSFYPPDVGLPKATALINRINLSCGLAWEALPHYLDVDDLQGSQADILVTCVDSHKARALMHQGLDAHREIVMHLDMGNLRDSGQFVLGCPLGRYNPRKKERLRTAYELFPELTDTTLPEDDTPSCSTMEALDKQDLFINDTLVTSSLALLWRLLRHGEIDHHGAFVDLKTGSVRPLPIDPALWRRLQRQGRR